MKKPIGNVTTRIIILHQMDLFIQWNLQLNHHRQIQTNGIVFWRQQQMDI
ncbi:MAG: hypothetical protein ACI90V_013589 [Bacillariaceae sp.]|jgi:hypothetical protein